MGSVLGSLINIITGSKNFAQGKGYVSNEFDPEPIRNSPADGSVKYLIEGTAVLHGDHLKEKFTVFADSPVEAKRKFEAMFKQMHDWSENFSCRILKSWPNNRGLHSR